MPNLKSSLDFLPILWNFLKLDESAIFGYIPELVEFKSLLGKEDLLKNIKQGKFKQFRNIK